MLKHYLIIASRNLKKRWSYSFISVLGLSMALTAFTFIMLWVENEKSYDAFNEKADRIYRIHSYIKQDPADMEMVMTAPAAAGALKNLPGVENAVRLNGPGKNVVVKYGNNLFNENDFYSADASVFQVFTLPLVNGNPNEALINPYSIVLSESMAAKYFENQNPMGKVLNIKLYGAENNYTVTGVMKDMPGNSHFHANFLASFSTIEAQNPGYSSEWGSVQVYTYVLLSPNARVNDFYARLSKLIKESVPKSNGSWTLKAIRLKDIHLKSHYIFDIDPNGSITSIYIFTSVGFLLLFVALINFISLSNARYTERTGEIGIRKTLGAGGKDIVLQFMFENTILLLTALLMSIVMVGVLQPSFNILTGKLIALSFSNLFPAMLTGLLCSLFSIAYPAFFLSSFQPAQIFGKAKLPGKGGNGIRKGLMVLQFTITIALIICTLIVNEQFRFIQNKDLGINIEKTIIIPLRHDYLTKKFTLLRDELLKIKGVRDVTASSVNPVNMNFMSTLDLQDKSVLDIKFMGIDYNFIGTMGLNIISGRDFSEKYSSDSVNAIIVNETAARKLKAMHLFDKEFGSYFDDPYARRGLRIIGVVNDFNFRPLYYPVEPLVLYITRNFRNNVEIKLAPEDVQGTISRLKEKWAQLVPGYPFDFMFPHDVLEKQYEADNRMKNIFDLFSLLSVLIACMGLFALASFGAEKRTKEVGIRKVLGSSVFQIIVLLSGDFMKLIAISSLLAIPPAYYFMQDWLEQFSFRIRFPFWLIPFSILSVFALTFLIVGFQALKAATANPARNLKYE
ncbi:MAG: FtsX-like permease family protein [Ignavibacteria bacterium]|nr:FtsX-like permease family protein [Ignavibacteria bacterium]MCU7516037.1 FtsX-like permease family protein [Ignavibacteria bacterium]